MKQPSSSFAKALRLTRRARGLSQEEFDVISSRTYISALERGIKQPTINKIDELAAVLGVHPLTLMVLSYAEKLSSTEIRRLLDKVEAQIGELVGPSGKPARKSVQSPKR